MRLRHLFHVLLILSAQGAIAQAFTGATNTDWNTAGNWSTGSVPTGSSTDVTVNNNKDIVVSGAAFTIGAVTGSQGNAITISSGASLTLGSSALYSANTKKNLTFSNSGSLTVTGSLEVWGDLVVNNSLTLNITGTMIVHGNISMVNGGSLSVSGSGTLQVGGNLSGGNNTQITTSGTGIKINVGGSISLGGGGSSITGPDGSIVAPGGCNVNGASCGTTVTPIELLFFKAEPSSDARVILKWATASEKNFDYFSIERSHQGIEFAEIAQVKGSGTSNVRKDYSFIDESPLNGRSYYRLKSVDYDLYTETFDVISVYSRAGKNVSIYPNPVSNGKLNVDLNFQTTEELTARVTDLMGTEVGKFKINSLSNSFDVDLKPGSYVVRIYSDNFSSVSRFVVR